MNVEILNYLPSIIGIIFFPILFLMMWKIYKKIIMMKYAKSFVDYVSILDYHINKAYEIIHKDRVLTYSLDGTRVSDSEFGAISHDFVKLVIKLIGPALHSEFKTLYGNEDTFIFNLIEHFNTRYEEDEIRKQTLESISDGGEQKGDNIYDTQS